ELAAAVVARAGVALGVLVGQHRADRLQHRRAGVVLRGDHLQLEPLAILFLAYGGEDFRVGGGQRALSLHLSHGSHPLRTAGAPSDPFGGAALGPRGARSRGSGWGVGICTGRPTVIRRRSRSAQGYGQCRNRSRRGSITELDPTSSVNTGR